MTPRPDATSPTVAFLTTEFAPLAKVGGLGDVVGALARELAGLGVSVTVWMPAYRAIWRSGVELKRLALPRPLTVTLGDRAERVELLETHYGDPAVRLILIDHPPSFGREGIYTDPATGEAFGDSDRRLVLLQRAFLQGLKALDLRPDVLHLNDHQSGLVPVYLKTILRGDPFFRRTGSLFTIHNLGYQGLFPSDILPLAGLPMDLFYPAGPLEFWGRVNFMKGGLIFADRLTTVSPRYAAEIQTTEEFGFGLEGVLRNRSRDLTGILNGIDVGLWDPASDPLIPHHYDAANLDRKALNRAALLERAGLAGAGDGAPLFGTISRLVDQKGIDLLIGALPVILGAGGRMVLLGSGQRRYEEQLGSLRERFPGRLSWSRGFDEPLAHLIEAGADFFVMPSRYEPCGLNQIISMRYGTLPIVRETGGLIDTVIPYDAATGEGTGFGFRDYTVEALLGAVRAAGEVHARPEKLRALQRRAMAQDFSWERSARAYLDIYNEIRDAHAGRTAQVRGAAV